MLSKSYPFYLANEARQPNLDLEVTDKYSGEVATRVPLAGPEDISAGIAGGQRQCVWITGRCLHA
ncbi:MAG: hypothetical protein IIC50_18655 [Planctomycetes bacterium]|nr:hypothetical protein [Planctomycetota bacterium]